MRQVNLGIVGLGRLGFQHATNIKRLIPDAKLYATCSLVPEELERAKREFEPAVVTASFDELISLKELDGLIIASNSQAHCEMICGALRAGVRNIYTEKPISMTLEEVATIRAAVKEFGATIIQVGYHRRFDSNYQRMKQAVDSGKIGRPVFVKMIDRDTTWDNSVLDKFIPSSGGLIFDMCTHDFDSARWILGSECKSVYAAGNVYKFESIQGIDIDNVALIAEFVSGAIGIFEASRNSAAGYHMETEVFGTDGAVRVNSEPYADRLILSDAEGYHRGGFGWFYPYWEKAYAAEIAHFVRCILTGEAPMVGLEDGCKTVEWAYAADRALREGKVIHMAE